MGDNGTYVNSVKFTAPVQFDPTRAKAFPYQTGVSVPLLIAGPMVQQPGREITHQVSSPDLYRLFAEIAGADVAASIPANRPLDAQSMVRSEERRVGKECVSTCRSRWSPYH